MGGPFARMGSFRTTPLLRSLPTGLSVHAVRSGETLDFAGVEERVNGLAGEIAGQIGSDPMRVVIGVSEPLACLSALFATWVSGNCAVLVNPDLKPGERSRVTAKVTPGLWVDDAGMTRLDGEAQPSAWPEAALILMTSGTTGDPKGVTHSLAGIEARLRLNVREIGEGALARSLCPLPLHFGHGLIGNCLTPLFAGGSLHLLERPGLADFAGLGALVDRLGVAFLSSVPSMWRMILRMSPPPERPLERVHVGSAPLSSALWGEIVDWCGTEAVFNTYGMTETANWISGARFEAGGADGRVGAPWGGRFRVRRDGVLHDTGRGEVAVETPSRMLGLWGDGEPCGTDAVLMTGDIGELSEDGSLRLVGRIKNEINRAGIKVLAEEVDMLLERHPDVAEACSFGIPDAMSGELVGAVVRVAGNAVTEAGIIAWCRAEARAEAVPHRIALVEDIPRTDRGKPDRAAIREEMVKRWS